MSIYRSVTVDPEISDHHMHAIWDEIIEEATLHPGETVALLFAPGIYPLPEQGSSIYKDPPTPMHVSPPGVELRFCFDEGELHITSHKGVAA